MECCGNKVETPFCPMCGKATQGASIIQSLLWHIHTRIVTNKRHLKETEEYIKEGNKSSWRRREPDIEMTKRSLEKWTSWEKALRELIKKAANNTSNT